MSTNLTIDDSSSDIIYSGDWALQSSDDPNTDEFFQSTYHSAQADGASANITFIGSAIYLYGTKGPGHANYSVQFDNFIIFYSANQSETRYQQLLFGQTFNTSGSHFVSLTSRHVSSGSNWLDLDYITITVSETDRNTTVPSATASASTPTASPTISPPWLTETSSTGVPTVRPSSPSTTLPTSNSESSSSTNRVTLVLAAIFGAIIVAALIFGAGLFVARRGKRRRDDQMPLRPETPGTGTAAGMFVYKPPPSSPSFFAGQVSPDSPDFVQSAAALQKDFYRDRMAPAPEHDKPAHGIAHLHAALVEGRHTPNSMLSVGGATALTAVSTTQLLSPHLYKSAADPMLHYKQSDSMPVVSMNPRSTQVRSPSEQLPIYKQHRAYESESAISVLGGSKTAAGLGVREPDVVVLPGFSEHPLSEKTENGTGRVQPQSDERPAPVMPLHAAHRPDSDPPSNSQAALPKRPKRPTDGLLDFLGSHIAHKLERSATAKRRRDDANSTRTNFLQV